MRCAKEDSVAEAAEITEAESVSLEDLDFVVKSLGEGVGVWIVKRIYNGRKPLLVRSGTPLERLNVAVERSVDPFGKPSLLG